MEYISFEGNEGVGKTILSVKVAEKLNATWTYEPNGETPSLKALRTLALSSDPNMTPIARELLMLANRSMHHKLLKDCKVMVSDRSFFSGLVYANLNGFDFEEWMGLYEMVSIPRMPKTIIFVSSSVRRIVKEEGNIYDHANDETLSKIDKVYQKALVFIKGYPLTKHIRVIEYFNDFQISIEDNVNNILKQLKGVYHE